MKTKIISLSLILLIISKVVALTPPTGVENTAKAEKLKEKLKPIAIGSGEFSLSSFAFTENKGQVYGYDGLAHPEVKFVFQQAGTHIFLLEKGIAYQFTKTHYPEGYQELIHDKFAAANEMEKIQKLQKLIRAETYRMDMTLVGANQHAKISTEGRSADYTNYYTHNVLDVHTFNKITYHEIYPGIDWVIYSKNNQIKYDFVVKPGADPCQIKMEFTHQEDLSLNQDGGFTLKNRMGSITEKRPESFQNGKKIDTKFVLEGNKLKFKIEEYSSVQTLIIDPALAWATYYGGSSNDYGFSVSIDPSGNPYLAGWTGSSNNIASSGFQNNLNGTYDAFLVKLNSAGICQWATYYGGTNNDYAFSCSTDLAGNSFLVGYTQSTVGITSGGHQNLFGGGLNDGFLVKFNSAGLRDWASYYGGSGDDIIFSCSNNTSGDLYVAGTTPSTNNISSGGHQNAFGGGSHDAFLVKFNVNGVRQWATYYGGSNLDYGRSCICDVNGNIYFSGSTESANNIAAGGFQNNIGGLNDAFLIKFNSSGNRLWGTYYGGANDDYGRASAIDMAGNIYLTGTTSSTVNIASGGSQTSFGGSSDAFLVKFNTNCGFVWSTYYGGTLDDTGNSCSVDALGNIFVAGTTKSTGGIASSAYQYNYNGGTSDGLIVKFNANGIQQWGSYFGSSNEEQILSCANDANGHVYLYGHTSSNSNISLGGHQIIYGGGFSDSFLAKFCDDNLLPPSSIVGNTITCLGNTLSFSVQPALGANSYSWSFSGNSSGGSVTNTLSLTPNNTGVLSVVSQNTCGTSFAQTVTVLVEYPPIISVNSGSICNGQYFTISPAGATSYTITGGSAVVSPNANSAYSVSGTSSAGCLSTLSAVSSVTVNPLPTIIVSGTSTAICEGEIITLTVSGAYTYTWYNGSNSTSLTISPIIGSIYTVIGKDSNACENSASITQQVNACVGINTLTKTELQLIIYPNPNSGEFVIKSSQKLNISVFNALGQLILKETLTEGKNKINLGNQPNGIYFIRSENELSSLKFIKQ